MFSYEALFSRNISELKICQVRVQFIQFQLDGFHYLTLSSGSTKELLYIPLKTKELSPETFLFISRNAEIIQVAVLSDSPCMQGRVFRVFESLPRYDRCAVPSRCSLSSRGTFIWPNKRISRISPRWCHPLCLDGSFCNPALCAGTWREISRISISSDRKCPAALLFRFLVPSVPPAWQTRNRRIPGKDCRPRFPSSLEIKTQLSYSSVIRRTPGSENPVTKLCLKSQPPRTRTVREFNRSQVSKLRNCTSRSWLK